MICSQGPRITKVLPTDKLIFSLTRYFQAFIYYLKQSMVGVTSTAEWVFQSLMTRSLQQLWRGDRVCGVSPKPLQPNFRQKGLRYSRVLKTTSGSHPWLKRSPAGGNSTRTDCWPLLNRPCIIHLWHKQITLQDISICLHSAPALAALCLWSKHGIPALQAEEWGCASHPILPGWCCCIFSLCPTAQGCPSPLTDHSTQNWSLISCFSQWSPGKGQSTSKAAPVSAPLPAASYEQVVVTPCSHSLRAQDIFLLKGESFKRFMCCDTDFVK